MMSGKPFTGTGRRFCIGLPVALALLAAGPPILAAPATDSRSEDPQLVRAQRIEPDGKLSFVPRWRAPSAPRWAVALSGGAALGIAHLGVLRELEADGLVPDMIAGTSAGAMIGGLYASGQSTEVVERMFREKNWNSIFRETPRTMGISAREDPLGPNMAMSLMGRRRDGMPLKWRGVIPDWQIFREFVRFYGRAGTIVENDLDRLPIPFRAVTCDLDSKEVFAPRHTPLFAITRASIGLPILSPVTMGERVLVDGGVLENVPVPTARKMGAEFVVAVAFQGSDEYELKSFLDMLGRSYAVAFGAQRRPAIESANTSIDVDTKKLKSTDFYGHIDELVDAGKEAWWTAREKVLAALESYPEEMAWYDVRSIEAWGGTSDAVASSVAERLEVGGTTRRVSSLRLEFELIRMLRSGAFEDGWFRVLDDGRLGLELIPAPPVEDFVLNLPAELESTAGHLRNLDVEGLSPIDVLQHVDHAVMDARREGYFLAGVTEVDWDAASGSLRIRVEPGTLASVDLVSFGHDDVPTTRPLRRLEGGPAHIDELERAIVKMDEAGGMWRAGSALTRTGDEYALRLGLADPPKWRAAWNLGIADEMGMVIMGRFGWPGRLGAKRWGAEIRAATSKEGLAVGLETGPVRDWWLVPYVRVGGGSYALRSWDPSGKPEGWSRFGTAIASAGFRTGPTTLGQLEFGPKLRWTSGKAYVPKRRDDFETDLALEAVWHGNLQDDPRLPRKGAAWSLGGAVPLAGEDRPWIAFVDLEATARLGRHWRLSLLGRMAETGDERQLPADRWGDVGAWWQAPGLDAGRGRAREFRRATLALRRQVGKMFGATITAGVSGAVWRLGAPRLDPYTDDDGWGVSVFLDAATARIGPLTIGFTYGSVEGNEGYERAFFLLSPERITWPGPVRPRDGAILP